MADNRSANGPKLELRPGGARMMDARANAEKPKEARGSIKRLFKYIGSSKKILFMMIFLMVIITVIDVLGPFFQQKAIDTIKFVDGRLTVDFESMVVYLAVIGIIFLLSGILNYSQSVLAAKLSQSTVYNLRNDLFKKISRLPISYVDLHQHGDLMSRMTNDAENISNAVAQSITVLFQAVFTVIGVTIMMIYYSRLLTVIAIITIPVTIMITNLLSKFMARYFKKQQRYLGQLNGEVEEMVTSYKTVVAYGKEQKAISDFEKTAEELRGCAIRAKVWGSVMGPIMNFLGNLQYVIIAAVGGYIVLSGGALTIGAIQAMLGYSKKFSRPISMIANQFSMILTALAGAERIFDVLDTPDEVDEGKEEFDIEEVRGDIEFEDIDFGYVKNHKVLKQLSLLVKSGQKIAIVGSTGSGKTTIVNLLTRFYELDGGRITVDGKDITELSKRNLRKMIAIVLQDTVLFKDSIKNNIKYGNLSATDEQITQAADIAMADHFIRKLPDGYDMMLTEGGDNLSEGQRQLIAIARAVLADPKILILDEATSSVDTRTELKIQTAMMNLMKGRTSLVIAHRLSTIRDADKIVVLSDGRIVETGSHDELIEKRGEYFKLYEKQFAGIAT